MGRQGQEDSQQQEGGNLLVVEGNLLVVVEDIQKREEGKRREDSPREVFVLQEGDAVDNQKWEEDSLLVAEGIQKRAEEGILVGEGILVEEGSLREGDIQRPKVGEGSLNKKRGEKKENEKSKLITKQKQVGKYKG